MKTSVISDEFRQRYLSRPGHEGVFEARAIVFDGSDDYHHRINDPALGIDENCILVIRGSGPLGWPGSAEVVNMQPPDALLAARHHQPADARRRAPVGHVGQPLDPQRLARKRGRRRARLAAHRRHRSASTSTPGAATRWSTTRRSRGARREAPPPVPPSNTPWEELFREKTGQLAEGGVLEFAVKYRGTSKKYAAAQSLNLRLRTQLEHRHRQQVLVVEIDDRIIGPGVAHARHRLAVAGDFAGWRAVGPCVGEAAASRAGGRTARTPIAVAPLSICSGLVKVTTTALPLRRRADRQGPDRSAAAG